VYPFFSRKSKCSFTSSTCEVLILYAIPYTRPRESIARE
jgi:hypothetical protein